MADRNYAYVTFYNGMVLNQAKTDAARRPIYDDKEMVRIRFAGDTKQTVEAPAHEKFKMDRPAPGQPSRGHLSYAEVYAEEYRAFKSHDKQAQSGTPIAHLPFISPARQAELIAQNVHTAEALADLDDNVIGRLGMGTRDLVEQTRVWLGKADAAAQVAKAEAERDAVQARLAKLEAMLAAKDKGADRFEAMDDDELRAFLAEHGAHPRANAAREKLLAAAREIDG